MNANGSGRHQLTGCAATDPSPCAAGDDSGTAWSPDGTKIAFARDVRPAGGIDRQFFVLHADGSGQHPITAGPALPGIPAWQRRDVGEGH